MKALRKIRRSLLGAAVGLATISACAESQAPPSFPSEPPPPAEQPTQQSSKSAGQGQSGSASSEQQQQGSEEASSPESSEQAGESAQSESGATDREQQPSSESDTSPGSEQSAESSAAQQQDTAGERERTGDSERKAASQQDGAADKALDSGDTEQGSERQQQSGAPVERDALGSPDGERDAGEAAEGADREPGDTGEVADGTGRELGDPGEAAEGADREIGDPGEIAVGGIPIDEVPPELLEAFGRGRSGTRTDAMNEDELARALERLAEHQGQVDELIQQEQTAAAAESGDVGEDATGIGAAAPPLGTGGEGRRAELLGEVDGWSVSTASTDDASKVGSGYRQPADVGDGSDDDTLAAQLRELATNESDPVLRERYWEEYRKHKGIE